jgi:hypothetical protein
MRTRQGYIDIGCHSSEVDQPVYRRQVGDEAAKLVLAIVLNDEIRLGPATA